MEINIVHGFFLLWLVISEAAVSFWQTSPGSFAKIQIGGGQQKQHQQQAQRVPFYLPQQQSYFAPPPQQIGVRRIVSGAQSNHIAPFVHFSASPPSLNRDLQLKSTIFQAYPSSDKEGRSREGRRDRENKNDAIESKHDKVSVKKNKKNETDRNVKQLKVDNLEEFFQGKTDGRENFLKRVVEIVEKEGQFDEEFDDNNEKDYLVTQEDIVTNEIDEGMSFFKQAGLFPDDDIKQQQKTLPFQNFLDVEKEAVENETEDLAQEISSLLAQLEETGDHEDTMIRKAKNIIIDKLDKYPINFLLQDEDFIDSVFFRFALMDLPLRHEDLEMYRGYQVNRVLRSSIRQASKQAQSLLEDLTTRQGKSAQGTSLQNRRTRNINKTRKELQKLLKLIS